MAGVDSYSTFIAGVVFNNPCNKAAQLLGTILCKLTINKLMVFPNPASPHSIIKAVNNISVKDLCADSKTIIIMAIISLCTKHQWKTYSGKFSNDLKVENYQPIEKDSRMECVKVLKDFAEKDVNFGCIPPSVGEAVIRLIRTIKEPLISMTVREEDEEEKDRKIFHRKTLLLDHSRSDPKEPVKTEREKKMEMKNRILKQLLNIIETTLKEKNTLSSKRNFNYSTAFISHLNAMHQLANYLRENNEEFQEEMVEELAEDLYNTYYSEFEAFSIRCQKEKKADEEMMNCKSSLLAKYSMINDLTRTIKKFFLPPGTSHAKDDNNTTDQVNVNYSADKFVSPFSIENLITLGNKDGENIEDLDEKNWRQKSMVPSHWVGKKQHIFQVENENPLLEEDGTASPRRNESNIVLTSLIQVFILVIVFLTVVITVVDYMTGFIGYLL